MGYTEKSNKGFTATAHGIDMAHNIWGKSVPDLKGNNTMNKPIPVAGDLIQGTEELFNLHKDIYLMTHLFFFFFFLLDGLRVHMACKY